MIEAAPDAIVVTVATSGIIVLFNAQAERLFGFSRDEILGQTLETLVPERFRAGHPAHRATYAGDPRVRPMALGLDLFARRKDGSEFPAEISLAPIQTVEGARVMAAIRDITERRETQMALVSANRELEAFCHSVAHDLRAPLRGMNGFAQALLDDYRDKLDETGLDFLNEIHFNARRMAALIDALLSLSRVSRSEIALQRVNLTALARSTVAGLAAADPERVVDIKVQDNLIVDADLPLARALLENLIGNAWKFTSRASAPRIEVGEKTGADGARVFYVRDNGAGFDMAHAGKLFAAFQRLHTVGEFPGTGIGLATAQRIVQRHGGVIWADGEVGVGATFNFTLQCRSKPKGDKP